jgi:LDH2 family malate/lactate/ureidoglycolate dehydrogenase
MLQRRDVGMKIQVEDALNFCIEAFKSVGCPAEDAVIASEIIMDANLDGVDSHGISRLPIYIKRVEEGKINSKPDIRIEKKQSVLLVDGDNGIGQVVAHKAMKEALSLAKEQGVISVAIRNSNHFGQAGYYCKQAANEEAFCMITTNSPKGIPPWGGKEAYFGTNPIAFGFPTRKHPIIVDMSSSIVARGKIILAAKNNEPIPDEWAIDHEGRPTTQAAEALKGAVLPFGGPKGYALALSLEVLAGILSGAAFGPHVNSIYEDHNERANVGHFMIVSDIRHYMNYSSYLDRMNLMISEIKSIPQSEGVEEIMIPGERKREKASLRLEEGIPLSEEVYAELSRLANALQIKLPGLLNTA